MAPDNRENSELDALGMRQVDMEAHNSGLQEAMAGLEASAMQHRQLFEWAPVGYCVIDAEGKISRVNTAAEDILGRDRQFLLGTSLANHIPLTGRVACVQRLHDSSRHKRSENLEIDGLGPNGGAGRVHIVVTSEHDDAGTLCSQRVALIDVSSRKRLEAKLRLLSAASEVLAASLEYATNIRRALQLVPSYYADLSFVDLRSEGQACSRLYPEAASGDLSEVASWCDAVFPLARVGSPQSQVFIEQSPTCAVDVRPASEHPMHHQARAVMIVPLIAHGKSLGTATFVRSQARQAYQHEDVCTALELANRCAMAVFSGQLHEQVQKSMRARQQVLGTVSHDLKNILTCLKMRTEVLPQAGGDKAQAYRRSMSRLVKRMDGMVDDLLDVASIESGCLSLRPTGQSAAGLVEEVIEGCSIVAASKGVALISACAADIKVYCDPERCMRVLSNLIDNAIKYSPVDSNVQVTVGRLTDCRAVFRVIDEGPGVDPQSAGRVFESFWQAPGTPMPGHGLGLAISRGIVEASGGCIWLEPHTHGGGAVFCFSLPLDQRQEEALAQGTCVLVADDDDETRQLVCETLQKAGYRTLSAANGEEALRLAHGEGRPALVVLDLDMPLVSGWEYLRRRAYDYVLSEQKVIVLTAEKTDPEHIAQNRAVLLTKPLSRTLLVDSVNRALGPKAMPEAVS